MDNSEELPISKMNIIRLLCAAYRSMYEPKEEETEIETEEDEDDNSST